MLRPPRSSQEPKRESALDYEIAQEQAAALGRLGRRLEGALAALALHDQNHDRNSAQTDAAAVSSAHSNEQRERLLSQAGDALWCFLVQRESCGIYDQRLIVRDYGVPVEVLNRAGAMPCPPRRRRV